MEEQVPTLERLYAAHAQPLLRLAVLACGDRTTAEDIVHDTFVRWHQADPGPALGAESAYLRRTVLNLASNHHRWGRRHRDSRLPVAPDSAGADTAAVQAHVAQRVVDAVRALPERQRDCALLTFFDGLRTDEVADVLGISPGSVKTHLHRARAALRPALEDLR